eukprot:149535-Rhodomonas_salina.1
MGGDGKLQQRDQGEQRRGAGHSNQVGPTPARVVPPHDEQTEDDADDGDEEETAEKGFDGAGWVWAGADGERAADAPRGAPRGRRHRPHGPSPPPSFSLPLTQSLAHSPSSSSRPPPIHPPSAHQRI